MTYEHGLFEFQCLSSLAKVFPDEKLQEPRCREGSALLGEVYSFQIAYRCVKQTRPFSLEVRVASPELNGLITVRRVGLVPSELPGYADADEHVLRMSPGLYPDPLYPLEPNNRFKLFPNQWRSLWVEISLDTQVKPGVHTVEIQFVAEEGEVVGRDSFSLNVIPVVLPEQELIHTEWFHADCLATHYQTEVFSELHWQLIEAYVATASRHGVNMLLTPLFTPPLDTKIGGERPTVQLVDVSRVNGIYSFGFERLKRWIDMCDRNGIYYIEFSHLFTQWGAKHAPKIVVLEEGVKAPLFGWHTDATGEEYGQFLDAFLPALIEFIHSHGLDKRCFFHVSDEPHEEHLESYRSASEKVRKHTKGFPVIDALSNYEFYEKGMVSHPIPSNDHVEVFLNAGVSELWTYYCCAQYKDVANRFFHMPSARNRILGTQLYKFDMKGFLHWGYNFWNSQYSIRPINPYEVTDADGAFPSGDAFLVYPGESGPIESIRLKVLFEALQDLRALKLLEGLIGREETLRILEEGLGEALTFRTYPRQAQWLLSKREQINKAIYEKTSESWELG
ncbi:DUF4091 domain-containing protein [Cohnella abietis]|uniref:Glycoside hydrolase 123 catalytic domain-containing protein n=1 Tax=Cohnella abietis TaxID=2507935 RepID=A0A3T1D5K3_9BACL|nr:glycoside hydrolase domain-containing protein [Cohnella abietis]BBI33384.1 hypothetical protein KCTCHS21_27830 [Cohnella abietis]